MCNPNNPNVETQLINKFNDLVEEGKQFQLEIIPKYHGFEITFKGNRNKTIRVNFVDEVDVVISCLKADRFRQQMNELPVSQLSYCMP